MIYLFGGEDYYESFNRSLVTANNLATKTSSEVNSINADEITDVNYILQLLEGVDMFSATGILLLKRLLNNKKLLEYFAENFDTLNKYNIVIWHDSKPDSKLKLVKKIAENKLVFNFESPKEGELKNWISIKAKEKDIPLSTNQINFIFERLQFNKFSINTELEKISLYIKTKKIKTITDDLLEDLMGLSVKGDMWKFLDYFGNKNKIKALIEFDKITKYEDNTQLLISMINRELRLMLQYKFVKENGHDISELKQAPFVIKKTAEKSRNFTKEELEVLLKRLFELDTSVKSGILEEKSALTLYLATM